MINKIKTKFNIGDTAWVMYENRPAELKVISISISLWKKCTNVSYYVDGLILSIEESKLFKTKKHLIKSL